ncbi:MAG: antibiotic biosynthesis monooxygenase [Oceanospirillaceae bacterium]|nr:antibiotic biosynthesis monooxygenase [Oceanospirillaceae bacterium]
MFAVVVNFTLKAESQNEFMQLILANATTSLESEANCHQFDVCSTIDRPNEVFLYELYADGIAFDTHLASEHFKRFASETEHMVQAKEIRLYPSVVQY